MVDALTPPPAPITALATIRPVEVLAANLNQATQVQTPLAVLAAGTVLQGYVLKRDGQNNPVLRTNKGDVQLESAIFIKTGSDVVFQVDANAAGRARILSINGLPPQEYAAQAVQNLTRDTVSASPMLAAETPIPEAAATAPPSPNTATLAGLLLGRASASPAIAASNPLLASLASTYVPPALQKLPPNTPLRITVLDILLPAPEAPPVANIATPPAPLPLASPPIPSSLPTAADIHNTAAPAPVSTPTSAPISTTAQPITTPLSIPPTPPPLAPSLATPVSTAPLAPSPQPTAPPAPAPANAPEMNASAPPASEASAPTPYIPTRLLPTAPALTNATGTPVNAAPVAFSAALLSANETPPPPPGIAPTPTTPYAPRVASTAYQQLIRLDPAYAPPAQPIPTSVATPPVAESPSLATPTAASPATPNAPAPAAATTTALPSAAPDAAVALPASLPPPALDAAVNPPVAPRANVAPAPAVIDTPASAALLPPTSSVPPIATPSINPATAQFPNALTTVVIGHEPDGATMLHSALGVIKLYTPQPLPIASQLTLDATPDTAAPAAPHIAVGTDATPTLTPHSTRIPWTQELARLLPTNTSNSTADSAATALAAATLTPPALANLLMKLPASGNGLTHGLITFITAIKAGEVRQWLDKRTVEALNSDFPKLAASIRDDTAQMQQLWTQSPLDHWSGMLIPILAHGQMEHLRFYLRDDTPDDHQDKSGGMGGKRFLVELDLSQLGPMQIDGFVRGEQNKHCDLMIRTLTPMQPELANDLRAIFDSAMQTTGYAGYLGFQHGAQHFIQPIAALKSTNANILLA